ncbi:MAG: hypothetical protein EOL97_08580 [Spirochaetia bacterium]|nr:hypothetical protein [Spirochaetia bacterium]
MEITLPTQVVAAETINPRNLILFSKPKIGKSEAVSKLKNCLILDLESGTKMFDAMKVEITDINHLFKVIKAIKESDHKYDYIAVDTITKLEEMILPLAEDIYSKTPMGSKWFTEGKLKYNTIIALPNGSGYLYLKLAFVKVINALKALNTNLILIGHVKDIMINKTGVEFSALDVALTGKLKLLLASDSDSIGYMYRGKNNENFISFISSDEVACGSRSKHLRNANILISKLEENGELVTYWENIYK